MTVTTTTDALADLSPDLLLIPLTPEPGAPLVDALAETLGEGIRRAVEDFSGETGAATLLYPDAVDRAVLVGIGEATSGSGPSAGDLDAEALRTGAAAGASVALDREAASAACLFPALDADAADVAQALTEGFVLGCYRYRRYKTDDGFEGPSSFALHLDASVDADVAAKGAERGRITAEAACTARDLVNTSPHDKTAAAFAERVRESGTAHGYDVETWDEDRIRSENMGGLLAVNKGSFDPPSFSILTWNPENAVNERPIVLVGKGVMFDTGGLSLKDTKGSMDMMKCDMGGAAVVVGALEALADLGVPLHVVGLIPATDNRPGNKAYVPGDVVTMHSGATVEVMNTDAEGRMLLADALSYAKGYDPELVVDFATLTGAQVVALGEEAAAVMTQEDDGAAERLYAIQRAGERTGERVHPLPMYSDYKKHLDSPVADLKNVGGRAAGCITAGKFLEHFIGFPWLHLDIAGPAFRQKPGAYGPEGGTGFGVRLMAAFLSEYVVRVGE